MVSGLIFNIVDCRAVVSIVDSGLIVNIDVLRLDVTIMVCGIVVNIVFCGIVVNIVDFRLFVNIVVSIIEVNIVVCGIVVSGPRQKIVTLLSANTLAPLFIFE